MNKIIKELETDNIVSIHEWGVICDFSNRFMLKLLDLSLSDADRRNGMMLIKVGTM